MIALKNLSCHFDERLIFEKFSLEIESHLCILGANGSGKSSLAKAICGLNEFSGEIEIDGKNIQTIDSKAKAKSISYIPAKLEIYDSYMLVEEFVLLGRFPHKESFFDYSADDREIVTQTLEFLKISHLKGSLVSSLSSGEQQLILIAQALVQQSKIIIFDEPTANLDPHNAKVIAEHIKGLKEYHQVILITHDLHLAAYIDSPVLFIKNTQVNYYREDFFTDATLQELYGVRFKELVVQYD